MKECANCGNPLSGLQKRFCSIHCKNVVNSREYNNIHKDRLANERKVYYKNHIEEIHKQKSDYYQKNIEKLRKRRIDYGKLHPEIDKFYKQSPKGRLLTYKRGAIVRNLEFELSLSFFLNNWNKNCHYCGEKVSGIGLDRVDNDIGYVEDNVVICCRMCNRMKHAFSKSDFINQCHKITNNMKGKVSVNINSSDYVYIDGASGQELTKEEFTQKYRRTPMGGFGMDAGRIEAQETSQENKSE